MTNTAPFQPHPLPLPPAFDGETTAEMPATERSPMRPGRVEAAVRDKVFLTVLAGPRVGESFALGDTTILGRGLDVSILIPCDSVSRRHASVVRVDDAWVFADLASTNGCFVHDQRIHTRLLRHGDRVRLGPDVVLRFDVLDAVEAALHVGLHHAAARDALTGACNRRVFTQRLDEELAAARRNETPIAVVSFDIDHFKQINDRHGHPVGDAVLVEVAARATSAIRSRDLLARVGGEEFSMILVGATVAGAAEVAERVRRALHRAPIEVGSVAIDVRASFGVAATVEETTTLDPQGLRERLLTRADRRLYQAKRAGRDVVCAFDDLERITQRV